MNITNRHFLNIVVNGDELELESQDSANLRLNNTIYNPEKVSITQSEYSFTFKVPFTPKNNKIFGFANVPSVRGKFVRTFNTYVYADNIEIFKGVMRLSSIGDDGYNCNLISIKNSSIDEIFGESKMNDIKWYITYNGASTQNEYNAQTDPDVFFPLASYGAFQKDPYFSIASDNNEVSYYTGTNLLDKWVKYYNETFVPSPKLIEVVKKMIEQKGYTWSGDVFQDELINKIYLSSHIGNEQSPNYNWGGERGHIGIGFDYQARNLSNSDNTSIYTTHDLRYPEEWHYLKEGMRNDSIPVNDSIYIENIFDGVNDEEITNHQLWENGYIVIPADGYYKIRMYLSVTLQMSSQMPDSYPRYTERTGETSMVAFNRQGTLNQMPIEIHLVKNNSNELELISTNNINYQNIANTTNDYYSDYPHEANIVKNSKRRSNQPATATEGEYYFMPKGYTRGYDQRVNPDFVMGMSCNADCWAIAKRGRSFDKEYPDYGYNSYICEGYSQYKYVDGVGTITPNTDYQKYGDTSTPPSITERLGLRQVSGYGYAVVWLNKNDMLSLKLVTKVLKQYASTDPTSRIYYNKYPCYINGSINIDAFSPKKNDLKKSWNSESAFDKDLNIGEFLSNEETQLEFFNNFLTTFNLTCNVEGKNIEITKNANKIDSNYSVEVDNRVDLKDVETEIIDFPTSIDIKFTIDEEESGFYHSVPDEHINDDDWKVWADIGSEKIELNTNEFSTNEITKTSKFSRNWMMDFHLMDYYNADKSHVSDADVTLNLPIVAKDEDFIDGGDYEAMMKVDGRSLKQRMWFKNPATDFYVPNKNGAKYNDNGDLVSATEYLRICTPTDVYEGYDVLRFTKDRNTLLMRYFNIDENTDSNYANIEVYLTPQEYMALRHGAMVRFDNDRYRLCSITGYCPVGNNKTKLKLMKM